MRPPRVLRLHPGELACVERGDRLETLLGSCVAIVLTDPRRSIGAMCHVVHAGPPAGAAARPTAFGEAALAGMADLLLRHGMVPRHCLAWVYGGGNMFPGQLGGPATPGHVGSANVDWALGALQRAGIRVLDVALGGQAYRRLGWTVGPGAPEVQAVTVPAAHAPLRSAA